MIYFWPCEDRHVEPQAPKKHIALTPDQVEQMTSTESELCLGAMYNNKSFL